MCARYNSYNQEFTYQRAGRTLARSLETSKESLFENGRSLAVSAMAYVAIAAVMYMSLSGVTKFGNRLADGKTISEVEASNQDSIASRALEGIKSISRPKEIVIESHPETAPISETIKPAEDISKVTPSAKPEQQKPSFQPKDVGFNNKDLTWGFLMDRGYSKEQAAGVMGNLKQEHNFQTSDDGLAQWIGGRKAQLYSYNNPNSINTQLEHMGTELNTRYSQVDKNLRTAQNVEDATRIFQNEYEKCGDCREDKRINYAKQILSEHQ